MAGLSVNLVEGSPPVAFVAGELDLATGRRFTAALEIALAVDPATIVDMAEVTFVDAAGLRAILQTAALLNGSGPLTLVNASRVEWLLELVGLTDIPSLALRTRSAEHAG
jgi:anti-anti-sigma factor